MFISLFAVILVIVILARRMVIAKNSVYVYKNKILGDRPIEMIVLLLVLVSIITGIINNFIITKDGSVKSVIVNVGIFIFIFGLIAIDYNKHKVGIYENGILYRSMFYKWEKIYSYRTKMVGSDKSTIIFYLYDSSDKEKLNKFSITITRERNEEIVKAIGDNLDPSRS